MPTLRTNFAQRLAEFPDHAFGGDDIFRHRGQWADYFRRRIGSGFSGRIVLEVGSFDADFLCNVAGRHPGIGFVGLDWKFKATFLGAERVAAMGLKNVALLRGRAQDLRRIFADCELAEVWVFHPEPCDEPNQRQNRLVGESFLTDVHALLRDEQSAFCLKTDHPGYYQSVLGLLGLPEPEHFRLAREGAHTTPKVRGRDLLPPEEVPPASDAVRERFAVAATSYDFWRDVAAHALAADRPFAGEATVYENRFLAKRRPIYYVELIRR